MREPFQACPLRAPGRELTPIESREGLRIDLGGHARVGAFSRALDRLIGALESVVGDRGFDEQGNRGQWKGFAHNDENNRSPAIGVVQSWEMK